MVVINAFRDALSILREQPVLFVPMAVFALLQVPQLFANTLDPFVSIAVSLGFTAIFAFVTPVFYAGTIGMADDAASGSRTSLSQFWAHAKEHYVSMLGAYLLILGVSFGFSFVFSFGAVFAFIVVLGADAGLGVTLAVGAVVAVVVLLFVVAMFALHFYGHAIVIEDYGVAGAFSRSVSVVRQNVVPVLGYGLLSVVFGGLIGAVYGLIAVVLFPAGAPGEPAPTPDLLPAVLGAAGSAVLMTVLATFFVVFSVTLYRALIGADDTTAGTGTVETGTDSRPDDSAEVAE